MDERTMFELLEIYDAVEELEKVEISLTGSSTACGPGEGIMGNLSYVTQIISRFSPIYRPVENMDDSLFWNILENRNMDNHRKAKVLLKTT